jgi:ABC-type transport system substrate-binding protein
MKRVTLTLILLLNLMLSSTTLRADEGHGVVRMLDYNTALVERGDFGIDVCSEAACLRLLRLAFPLLFPVNAATGTINAAEAREPALITDPPVQPQREQQYHIGADRLWSDGSPMTAYDVAFSLIGHELATPAPLRVLDGVRIDDPQSLTVSYRAPDCTSQTRLNTRIVPVALAASDFRAFAESVGQAQRGIPTLTDWLEAFRDWYRVSEWQALFVEADDDEIIWGGQFIPQDRLEFADFRAAETDLALAIPPNATSENATTALQMSAANLILDPPLTERENLRRLGDIQLYESPGYATDRLVFNLSDPSYPRDAFIDGEPLEQLPHPILSDVRVRRAIRYAIDTQALIDVALVGDGVALNGAYSPASWAYDPSLPPWQYNPSAAEQLLDEAGWRGEDERLCLACAYPERRVYLSLRLMVDSDPVRQRVAGMIARQLGQVGINISIVGGDGSGQDYDLLLTGTSGATVRSREPDLTQQFSPQADVVYVPQGNTGSYSDPQLDALLERARATATCSLDERAAAYRDVQQYLNEQLPATWLYARDDFYAARGIVNFSPLPGEPLWNLTDWVVRR